MATGDQTDIFRRIKALLPQWFSDNTPVLDALLRGFAYATAFVYVLIAYAARQTRIKTATDGWLDMIAADFSARRCCASLGSPMHRLGGASLPTCSANKPLETAL